MQYKYHPATCNWSLLLKLSPALHTNKVKSLTSVCDRAADTLVGAIQVMKVELGLICKQSQQIYKFCVKFVFKT